MIKFIIFCSKAITATIAGLLLTSCNYKIDLGNNITGSGNIVKEERKLNSFTNVSVKTGIDCEIKQAADFQVTVEADDNVIKEIKTRVEETAKKVYESLGMSGFSRTDFIIMNDIPHFIEINTNPGLSPQSIFPQQAAHANIPFGDLLDSEINLALQRKLIWKR
mgnify:CR=1 FL=1